MNKCYNFYIYLNNEGKMSKILLSSVVETIHKNYNQVKNSTLENLSSQVDKTKNYHEQKRQLYDLENKVIKFQSRKKSFDALEASTKIKIEKWTESQATKPIQQCSIEDRSQIIKKAKWVKLAGKIALVAAISFGVLLGIGVVGLSAFTKGGIVISAAILIKIGIITASVGLLAAISGISAVILNHMKVIRQKRLLTSTNFNYFVQTHLKPNEMDRYDLLDTKLHRIYLDWEKTLKDWGQA